jgi:hypothetical protein
LTRFSLEGIESLIEYGKYFVLHAPRQTGKTSCLLALRDYLNKQGRYYAVYVNVEEGQAYRNEKEEVTRNVVSNLCDGLSLIIGDELPNLVREETIAQVPVSALLSGYLSRLSRALDRPLVVLIDEIDALVGDSLVSVLRQIRSGYNNRPAAFPQSVILCGVRDVRDYRIVLSNQDIITGGSAFNIKAESLRLGNFSKEEIHELYMQHTEATGQVFDEACFPMVWESTEGQPWLVNALGYEVTSRMVENRDRSIRITREMLFRARENIIYRRETHIDILIDKLREERVRNVIDPILANEDGEVEELLKEDDIQYVVDLGLIVRDKPLRIANGIYKEIIPRELTWARQQTLLQQPAWYMNPDNSLNMEKLLLDFQQFFRQNGDSWIERFDYRESAPQLLLQAFLQRIINGGGYIDREYGLGRGRTDLLIRKPLTDGYDGPVQYIVLELKIKRASVPKTIELGLEQTSAYMDKAAPHAEGHFILFNRDKSATWSKKIWHRRETYHGRIITVWGM